MFFIKFFRPKYKNSSTMSISAHQCLRILALSGQLYVTVILLGEWVYDQNDPEMYDAYRGEDW